MRAIHETIGASKPYHQEGTVVGRGGAKLCSRNLSGCYTIIYQLSLHFKHAERSVMHPEENQITRQPVASMAAPEAETSLP